MFEAQRLFQEDPDILSPWFPRGGDILIATLDTIDMTSPTTDLVLTVTLFTKNQEDSGEGASAGAVSIVRTSTEGAGREDAEWVGDSLSPGLLELVRYKFALSGGDGKGDYVLFRMLPPVWADAVKA